MKNIQNIVTHFGKGIAVARARRMRKLLLFSTIFSVLVLSWVIPRWTAPKNCISSTLVEQISLPDAKTILPTCNLNTRTLGQTPAKWIQNANLIGRIDKLNSLQYLVSKPKNKLTITISEQEPEILQFLEGEIKIGRNQVLRPTVLERALISLWIGLEDSMAAQVAGDFLWNYLIGNLKTLNQPEPWYLTFSGLAKYCATRMNLFAHEEYCSLHRELGDGLVNEFEDENGLTWSLYPVYTKILARSFLKLSADEQKKILDRLIFMNTFAEIEEFLPQTNSPTLSTLDNAFQRSAYYAFAPLGIDDEILLNAIEPFLMRNAHDLSYLVMDDDSVSIGDMVLPPAILENERSQKTIYPSVLLSNISRRDVFKYIDVREVVFIGCVPPGVRRLLEFEPFVQKVTFIRMCDARAEELQKILILGSDSYLKLNPASEFIEFNLKALRVTQKIKGTPGHFAQMTDLATWIESQGAQFDTQKGAYRPLAAFDAVKWFRWQ